MSVAQTIIIYMIAACIFFVLAVIFRRPFKTLLKTVLQAAVGLLGIYVVNFVANPLGAAVGINFISAVVTGILGIPGFICLYAVSYLSQVYTNLI